MREADPKVGSEMEYAFRNPMEQTDSEAIGDYKESTEKKREAEVSSYINAKKGDIP